MKIKKLRSVIRKLIIESINETKIGSDNSDWECVETWKRSTINPLNIRYEYKSGETAISVQRHPKEEVYHWMIYSPDGLNMGMGHNVSSESLAKSQALKKLKEAEIESLNLISQEIKATKPQEKTQNKSSTNKVQTKSNPMSWVKILIKAWGLDQLELEDIENALSELSINVGSYVGKGNEHVVFLTDGGNEVIKFFLAYELDANSASERLQRYQRYSDVLKLIDSAIIEWYDEEQSAVVPFTIWFTQPKFTSLTDEDDISDVEQFASSKIYQLLKIQNYVIF